MTEEQLEALSEALMEEMTEFYDGDTYVGDHDYVFARMISIAEEHMPNFDIKCTIKEN